MNKRDYLRSLGFNVGERGRLTPAMLEALKDFKDESPIKVLSVEMVQDVPDYIKSDSPLIREPRTLYGITKEGKKLGFTTCRDCTKHMSICSCQDGVLSPIIIVHSNDKEVRVK